MLSTGHVAITGASASERRERRDSPSEQALTSLAACHAARHRTRASVASAPSGLFLHFLRRGMGRGPLARDLVTGRRSGHAARLRPLRNFPSRKAAMRLYWLVRGARQHLALKRYLSHILTYDPNTWLRIWKMSIDGSAVVPEFPHNSTRHGLLGRARRLSALCVGTKHPRARPTWKATVGLV